MSATGSQHDGAPERETAPALRLARARWPGLLIAFALGALAALGQAPLSWAWVALAAHAAAIGLFSAPLGWRRAAWRGWAFGTGHFAVALFWIVEPFFVDPLRHGWMAPFALIFMAGGLALFWAGAFALGHALGRGRASRALWLAVALTGAEMLRSVVLTGFPWALVGHVWIGAPQMQLAALGGADSLTLLTLLAAALPTLCGARRARAGIATGALAGAALAALPAAWGAARLQEAPLPPADPPVIVRLVQPNAPQHLKWRPDMIGVFWERSLALTAAPPDGPAADLVLWPETSVPYLLESAAPGFARMAEAAGGAWVAAGIQRRDTAGHWRNALVALGPGGGVADVYDKHHLVPFGEYMPLGDLFSRWGVFGLAANLAGSYRPGEGPRLMQLGPGGLALPLICYEAIFSREIRDVAARPGWIYHATNDAWFGRLSGPYQHLAQARLRAVEFGLPVLRAANTGVSAAIDAHGRLIGTIPLGQAGHLDVALPRALPATPHARLGSRPVLAALAVLACIAAALSWRERLAQEAGRG